MSFFSCVICKCVNIEFSFKPCSCHSEQKFILDLFVHQSIAQSLFLSQVLPTSRSSQMITFTFSNGGVATMRTSGTEPKIKYYTELCAAPGNRWVTVKTVHKVRKGYS